MQEKPGLTWLFLAPRRRDYCNFPDLSQFPAPFVKYLLGTIVSAYRDLEDRMEMVAEKLPALDMVRKAVQGCLGKITKTEIRELCPSLSASSVEVALKKLVAKGELTKQGAGRNTFYVRAN